VLAFNVAKYTPGYDVSVPSSICAAGYVARRSPAYSDAALEQLVRFARDDQGSDVKGDDAEGYLRAGVIAAAGGKSIDTCQA